MSGVKEINPHHPTTVAIHDHWQKIAALLVYKFVGEGKVEITPEEIDNLQNMFGGELPTIVLKDGNGKITVWLVPESQALKMANQAGGRFKQ